ncbi:MAG: hypothetical protein RLZZ263_332 [Cyanobacteriota bacterium]|jgi:uncharacterized membrane protein
MVKLSFLSLTSFFRFALSRWNKSHHYQLTAGSFLSMFDAIFAVVTTLLVSNLPEMLDGINSREELLLPIVSYELVGLSMLLYWFKLRRLILMARNLLFSQLVFGVLSLLTIAVMPKLAALVIRYGNGDGSLFRWDLSQQVNVSFLAALFLFDGLALLFALSLRNHVHLSPGSARELAIAIECQTLGFVVLMVMALMELLLIWFNSQFIWLVPLVLVAEEILVARRFSR